MKKKVESLEEFKTALKIAKKTRNEKFKERIEKEMKRSEGE